METLMNADVFFFISSIGFVILFILMAVTLVYLIRLVRSATKMAKKVEANIESISDEAKELVLDFRDSPVMSFMFGRSKKRTGKNK